MVTMLHHYTEQVVAACRAGSPSQGYHGTSILCLVFSQGPHQPLMAPVPKLISVIGNEFNHH